MAIRLACLVAALTAAAHTGFAQEPRPTATDPERAESHEPHIQPTLRIGPAAGPITVDGELDDAGWIDAARTRGFTEFNPRDMVPAQTPTEVLITYDGSTLYVGFIVEDDPEAIRATLRDRDEAFQDDAVGIVLDTFGDNSWAYLLASNALGVQIDTRIRTNGNDDVSFDVVYQSAGRITETGYQVELAIPFSSLRFPDADTQTWKLNFYRVHPRESLYQYSWAALSHDEQCILCQSGTLVGIEGVQPGGQLELLPSVVASRSSSLAQAGEPDSFESADPGASASVGVRYPFRAGWTAEATLNPDFSQIESDASQIDVNTTFALSYPERRPFFQEGSDLFETWMDPVYTRSINDPIGAAKVIGRQGRTRVGYITAIDEHSPVILPFEEFSAVRQNGRSVSNILRVKRLIGESSFVGGLLTDRRMHDGAAGTTFSADALIRVSPRWQIEAQLLGSRTGEPDEAGPTADLAGTTFDDGRHTAVFDGEAYSGRAVYASLGRNGRQWDFDLTYREATPTFRADNGFRTRNDFRRIRLFNGWRVYPERGLVDQVSLNSPLGQSWNFRGERKARWLSPGLNLMLEGQTRLGFGYELRDERFRGVDFEKMGRWRASLGSDFSDRVNFGLNARRGEAIRRTAEPFAGEEWTAGLYARIKPLQQLVVQPSVSYARLEDTDGREVYSGYIARARLSYQFTRGLSLRAVGEYDDFDGGLRIEPLMIYRLNPFSVLYVGSTHGYSDFDEPHGISRTDRQLFFKLQYLFRP